MEIITFILNFILDIYIIIGLALFTSYEIKGYDLILENKKNGKTYEFNGIVKHIISFLLCLAWIIPITNHFDKEE